MKKLLALLFLLLATVCSAKTRDWKPAVVIGLTVTNVSGPLVHEANVIHYVIETNELVLQLEYTYHPSRKGDSEETPRKNSAPNVAVNTVTKIAVEGKHAYLVDVTGQEVKMQIKKKTKK